MNFVSKIRKQTDSLIITIPYEVVTVMKLAEGEICQFSCEKVNKNE